jgi:hypothetical protein
MDEKFNFSKPGTSPALSFTKNHFLAGFLTNALLLWIVKLDCKCVAILIIKNFSGVEVYYTKLP